MASTRKIAGKRGTTYRVMWRTTDGRQQARSFKTSAVAARYEAWRTLHPDTPDHVFDTPGAYWDIAQMAVDTDLTARVAACAAQQGKPDPSNWAADNLLTLAAAPRWAEAWALAVANGNDQPGRDPTVVTDGMILSAVQALGRPAG